MPTNIFKTRMFLVILSLIQVCFLIPPTVLAADKYATDELSVSRQYAYRLITRQMAINPVHRFSDNVKPISFREIAVLQTTNSALNSPVGDENVNSEKKPYKLIKELHFKNTGSSKDNPNVFSNFGEKFSGKQLTAFSAYGNFYLNRYLIASHETRVDSDNTSSQLRLYKFRLKTGYKRYSLSFARESLVLGPGYFGNLLLSNNVEPENTVMLKIEDPYKLPYLGYLRFYLWHISYDDNNRVNQDPNLLGFRLSIKPSKYFEASLTRTAYYGGTDNDRVSGLKDLIKIVTAEDENAETTINTDQLAAMDASLYLPSISRYTPFKGAKIYTERVWNDVKAFWQPEDKTDGVLFKLLGTSFLHGIYLTTGKLDFYFEYVKTTNLIYAHGKFGRDGMTDNGFIVGHFIGRDARAYLSELYYEFSPKVHGYLKGGLIERGLRMAEKQNAIQYGAGFNYFHSRNWQFGLDLNYIVSDKTDIDDSPVVYKFIDRSNSELQSLIKATYFLK